MTLCIFILTTLGLVYIVTQSSIMHAPRMWIADVHGKLEMLIYCPACTGFWVGVTLKFLGYWHGAVLEAGIIACALGALWGVYGPDNVWAQERGHDDTQEEKNEQQGTNRAT